ncbi:hypothetical protein [Streptomyces sp. NPDC126514]|uniref:hypothetical protein n=1 Tax=Streptomyces sp. NPDC126514 TaxID=3155210 RepID=UPI00332AC6B6
MKDKLAAVDELPGLEDAQRMSLREDVRRSCRSLAFSRYYSRLWVTFTFWGTVLLSIGGAFAIHAWAAHWREGIGWLGIVAGGSIGVIVFFAFPWMTRKLRGKYRRSKFLKRFFVLMFAASLPLLVIYPIKHYSWPVWLASAACFTLCFAVVALMEALVMYKMAKRRRVRLHNPNLAAALAILDAAALVGRNRRDWQSSRTSRMVISEIEDLARKIQDELSLSSRIGRRHADVFSRTLLEAARVAEVIRQHKKLIACASGEGSFEDVSVSLSNAARALFANDRGKLLKDAPEVILKRRVQILVRHLLPVILMVSAAFVLPLLPPISDQDKLADGIRITLLVSAVLALISPRSESSAKILDVLGKAIPGK